MDLIARKIEKEQSDGVSVKKKIIDFFLTSNRTNEEHATKFYKSAEAIGFAKGTDAFDEAIMIICKGLDLDWKELSKITTGV